jgi:hypothetical protein
VVESQPSKLLVAGSIPVSRSIRLRALGVVAGYGEMPSEHVSSERSRSEAQSAQADQMIRRKVVWGS